MRSSPRLGSVNAALVALYFAPVWGGDGLRALISPFMASKIGYMPWPPATSVRSSTSD